jgi:hypothetical protein
MVVSPDARSLMIIISLRSYRSTRTPARALRTKRGVVKKNAVSADAVAFSVPS